MMSGIERTMVVYGLLALLGCKGPDIGRVMLEPPGSVVAVGSSQGADVSVFHDCDSPDPSAKCREVYTDVRLLDASCPGGACAVDELPRHPTLQLAAGSEVPLLVHALQSGTTELDVHLRTEDGREWSATESVTFALARSVAIGRGAHPILDSAVLTGSVLIWSVDVLGDGPAPMYANDLLAISSSGDALDLGSTPRTPPPGMTVDSVEARAAHPGIADLIVRYGDLSSARHVRVVDPGEVVRIELHLLQDPPPPIDDGPGFGATALTVDSAALRNITWLSIAPVLVLVDGTLAGGGGQSCTVDPPDLVSVSSYNGLAVELTGGHAGIGTLGCTVGGASVRLPITAAALP